MYPPKMIPGPVVAPPPVPTSSESVALQMDPRDAEEFMRQMKNMSERQAMARANAAQKKGK